jgi:hypothetical protein
VRLTRSTIRTQAVDFRCLKIAWTRCGVSGRLWRGRVLRRLRESRSASAKATGRGPAWRGSRSAAPGARWELITRLDQSGASDMRARPIRPEIPNLSMPSGITSAMATTAFNGYRSAPSEITRLRVRYAGPAIDSTMARRVPYLRCPIKGVLHLKHCQLPINSWSQVCACHPVVHPWLKFTTLQL